MPYDFISSQNVKGKTLVVRLDLNSSVENGKILVSARIKAHAETVKELAQKGAKLVLLAHQGRKGDADFISLSHHARALAKYSERDVFFASWKEDFEKIIKGLASGEVLLLENTRFQEDEAVDKTPEEHSKSSWIKKIAANSDFFVQDALSACHRAHASVVGFFPLIPCFAGLQLEKELSALEKAEKVKKTLFILGGAKPEDSVQLTGSLLKNKKAESVFAGGLPGELFLKAKGISLGEKEKFFEEKGFNKLLGNAKELLKTFPKKILLPMDVALDAEGTRKEISVEELPSGYSIKDIGSGTVDLIKKKISESEFVVFNGPLGVYEEDAFILGTKEVFGFLSESAKPCILCGGDTETALEELNFSIEDFFYVSLAGKALLEYLSGKKLPGLEILKQGKAK